MTERSAKLLRSVLGALLLVAALPVAVARAAWLHLRGLPECCKRAALSEIQAYSEFRAGFTPEIRRQQFIERLKSQTRRMDETDG